jgi:hypothetical protein
MFACVKRFASKEIWSGERAEECATCHGTGRVDDTPWASPDAWFPPPEQSKPCPECHGTGNHIFPAETVGQHYRVSLFFLFLYALLAAGTGMIFVNLFLWLFGALVAVVVELLLVALMGWWIVFLFRLFFQKNY